MHMKNCLKPSSDHKHEGVEEVNTGVAFGYMPNASVLSTHESLENLPRTDFTGIILIGSIPILIPSVWYPFTLYLH